MREAASALRSARRAERPGARPRCLAAGSSTSATRSSTVSRLRHECGLCASHAGARPAEVAQRAAPAGYATPSAVCSRSLLGRSRCVAMAVPAAPQTTTMAITSSSVNVSDSTSQPNTAAITGPKLVMIA